MPQKPLLGRVVVKILKPDLGSRVDRICDRINDIQKLVVVRLEPVRHIHVPGQLVRLSPAGHLLELVDQHGALFLRDKTAGGYCIDQQLELGNFQASASKEKRILRTADRDNVKALFDQNINIMFSNKYLSSLNGRCLLRIPSLLIP